MITVFLVNKILAFATLFAHIGLMAGGVYFFLARKSKENIFVKFFARNGILFAFLTALFATALSLYYSEIVGFLPCVLCWYQRIFLYPQVILLGLALHKKENHILDYALALAIAGGIIALYHTYISYGGLSLFPCSATGVSCVRQYVFELGYISIPVMSLTSFLIIGAFLSLKKYFHSIF